ncbi:hypothetical protein [Streptomyces sp. NPDC057966]|uniref:hypothetical protein n=1 Tax=Streptomyces sp. NPDC057966 TaxID=3346292 RepID=UPI0036E310E4
MGVAGDLVEVGIHPVAVVQAAPGDRDRAAAQVDLDHAPSARRLSARVPPTWFLSAR